MILFSTIDAPAMRRGWCKRRPPALRRPPRHRRQSCSQPKPPTAEPISQPAAPSIGKPYVSAATASARGPTLSTAHHAPAHTAAPSPSRCRRFYTTDFDMMDEMFNLERNPDLPMEELTAMLGEFRK